MYQPRTMLYMRQVRRSLQMRFLGFAAVTLGLFLGCKKEVTLTSLPPETAVIQKGNYAECYRDSDNNLYWLVNGSSMTSKRFSELIVDYK